MRVLTCWHAKKTQCMHSPWNALCMHSLTMEHAHPPRGVVPVACWRPGRPEHQRQTAFLTERSAAHYASSGRSILVGVGMGVGSRCARGGGLHFPVCQASGLHTYSFGFSGRRSQSPCFAAGEHNTASAFTLLEVSTGVMPSNLHSISEMQTEAVHSVLVVGVGSPSVRNCTFTARLIALKARIIMHANYEQVLP